MARITAALHTARVFHKDLYLCHFYLDLERLRDDPADVRLTLIDLHRLAEHRSGPTAGDGKTWASCSTRPRASLGSTTADIRRFWKSTAAGSRCRRAARAGPHGPAQGHGLP